MLPDLHKMSRVDHDIERCLHFIQQQPFGNAMAREADIYRGFAAIRRGPELNDVGARRRRLGLTLRRYNVAQFAIIYAYFPPDQEQPRGMVSIRAVRHSRVKDVFIGVREPSVTYDVN